MNLGLILISSFVIALSGAMMPGPLLTATIGQSLARGPWAGPLLMVGHGALEILMVAALCFGLAPLLSAESVVGAVSLVGAAVLVWLAYGMVKSLPALSLAAETDSSALGRGNIVISGVLLSLANPYWTVWWATIGLNYILSAKALGTAGIAAFFTGHILADIAFYTAVSIGVHQGRGLLNDRAYRGIIAACAAALACFAVLFLVNGIGKLSGGAA